MSPFSIDSTTWRSPNYDERPGLIESAVVHSCEGQWPNPRVSSLPWLCKPASKVSCHYYICRDTTIFQLVDDAHEAWHAGKALNRFDNASSIGIELEHRAGQNWPPEQKDALAWLLKNLIAAHRIPVNAIETHGQIAVAGPYKRKIDPTNWPHDDFVRFRVALVVPVLHTVIAGPHGALAQQDRKPSAPAARYYPPGTPIVCDDFQDGYFHTKDQAGFIASGQVQA